MSRPQQRRGSNQSRRPQTKRPGAVDVWRNPGPLPEIQPIAVAQDPGALLRSLGDPPLIDDSVAAKAFISVIERAAAIAAALALSADLLAHTED
jgi:hypothetical protein